MFKQVQMFRTTDWNTVTESAHAVYAVGTPRSARIPAVERFVSLFEQLLLHFLNLPHRRSKWFRHFLRHLEKRKSYWVTVAHGTEMTLIALYPAIRPVSLLHLSVVSPSPWFLKKHPFASSPSVFHLAAYGHSASRFHSYINETNPCCVRKDGGTERGMILVLH